MGADSGVAIIGEFTLYIIARSAVVGLIARAMQEVIFTRHVNTLVSPVQSL